MTDRQACWLVLLAQPDEPCLRGRRGYRLCYAGDPTRKDLLKRDFARAWLTHRSQDAGKDEGEIVSIRRGSHVVLIGGRRWA